MTGKKPPEFYQAQHKKRLSWMPWLYYRLKSKHLQWAKPWQDELQQTLMQLETLEIADKVFISPDAPPGASRHRWTSAEYPQAPFRRAPRPLDRRHR
ncbi:MAG: hypothetical protein R3204_13925, partial [Oceanospirillum sp.]|nr:hypothetical protein [Oceanospirillum sp.]